MRMCVWLCMAGLAPAAATPADLVIASWNMEWLVSQETAHASRLACDAGRAAPLPCDVARDLSRDSADLARLASYVRRLDADVIAFQEVENAPAARRVFRGYEICISTGRGVQHTGFAVRRNLAFRCEPPLQSLALGERQRAGARLTLFPGTTRQIELLSVHLKSGCSRDALDSASASCQTLASQSAALGKWMRQRGTSGSHSMVLGDFNRVGPDAGDPFWESLAAESPATDAWVNAASGVAFSNCYRGQPFRQFIDHILISRALAPRFVRGSFRHRGFRSVDAYRYRLSDHCPISVSLRRSPN
jgi:endonuclease/exonuclease/phosphatase family metal-dependent hydrolase